MGIYMTNLELNQISVHNFRPGSNKVGYKLLFAVILSVNLNISTQGQKELVY
jgi:hypothetical protein